MSRKATPPQLKVIQGTARPDREVPDVPQFDILESFPDAPQHLNSDGLHMWATLGPQLVAARVLQVVDLFALEQLCYAWQRSRAKAKAGMDITAAEDMALKALFSEFGITPAARRKVTSAEEKNSGNRFGKNGKRPS